MEATRKTHPKISIERIAELSKLAKKIDREEGASIKAKGRAMFGRHETIKEVVATLRSARREQGLSLAEIGERSGIGKANLSRLENETAPNPTWDTIARYAEAVGRKIRMTVQ